MEWLIILVTLTALLLFFWRLNTRANSPKAGQPAPDFRLPDQTGKIHTLADFSGKWLALYFYPKDDTPGCTRQACKFRDDLHKMTELGAEVIGISVDNTKSHADFAKKYHLPFPLLADHQAEVAKRYHSLINLGVIKFARRNTFLIDPQGKIARIYFSASTSRNSTEIIADLKKLQTI
ncbi:MAG: peroxiredoxin [Nitrosomonas sp.]|nr:peroxiredoxin [Nitrosomonas sp.]